MSRTAMLILSLFLAGAVMADEPAVVRLSEPVVATDDYEDFGAAVDDSSAALALSALVDNAADYEVKE